MRYSMALVAVSVVILLAAVLLALFAIWNPPIIGPPPRVA